MDEDGAGGEERWAGVFSWESKRSGKRAFGECRDGGWGWWVRWRVLIGKRVFSEPGVGRLFP